MVTGRTVDLADLHIRRQLGKRECLGKYTYETISQHHNYLYADSTVTDTGNTQIYR